MKSKKERTLACYKTAGAYLRLFKYVYHLGWEYLQPVMPSPLWDRWHRIQNTLDTVQNELEGMMFREHGTEEKPGENFIRVFYGVLEGAQRPDENEYQKEACEIIEREIVGKLPNFKKEVVSNAEPE